MINLDSVRPYPRPYIMSAEWINKYLLGKYCALGTVLGHSGGLCRKGLHPQEARMEWGRPDGYLWEVPGICAWVWRP